MVFLWYKSWRFLVSSKENCKNSEPFQIAYCIERIYNVYGMAHVQAYSYLLNCLESILGTVPIYIYLILLYNENDVPTKHTFFSVY